MREIKLGRKTKRRKKSDARNVLPGDKPDQDPDHWATKLLVMLLHLANPALLSMGKTRSIIMVESRTSTIDQQVSKDTTIILKTLWFLLLLQVLPMELKLNETWTEGGRGNEASLQNQMMVAEGGDTDAIRAGAVVEAVAKV